MFKIYRKQNNLYNIPEDFSFLKHMLTLFSFHYKVIYFVILVKTCMRPILEKILSVFYKSFKNVNMSLSKQKCIVKKYVFVYCITKKGVENVSLVIFLYKIVISKQIYT